MKKVIQKENYRRHSKIDVTGTVNLHPVEMKKCKRLITFDDDDE